MAKLSKRMLAWKRKQPHGAIMRPETFRKIARESDGKRGRRIAGSAYKRTLKAKYKRSLGG